MFLDTDTHERITQWREFRNTLEECEDPFRRTLKFWERAPVTNKHLNQHNSQEWPTPWELLKQNRFCPVGIPLMIGYSLKLTTRFSQVPVLIKISIDIKSQRYYNLVEVENTIIDYENRSIVITSELP